MRGGCPSRLAPTAVTGKRTPEFTSWIEVNSKGLRGPDVEYAKPPGEVRLVYPWIGCGTCRVCASGNENLCAAPRFLGVHCDGGYADRILVPHPRYLLNLKGLDPVSAAATPVIVAAYPGKWGEQDQAEA